MFSILTIFKLASIRVNWQMRQAILTQFISICHDLTHSKKYQIVLGLKFPRRFKMCQVKERTKR